MFNKKFSILATCALFFMQPDDSIKALPTIAGVITGVSRFLAYTAPTLANLYDWAAAPVTIYSNSRGKELVVREHTPHFIDRETNQKLKKYLTDQGTSWGTCESGGLGLNPTAESNYRINKQGLLAPYLTLPESPLGNDTISDDEIHVFATYINRENAYHAHHKKPFQVDLHAPLSTKLLTSMQIFANGYDLSGENYGKYLFSPATSYRNSRYNKFPPILCLSITQVLTYGLDKYTTRSLGSLTTLHAFKNALIRVPLVAGIGLLAVAGNRFYNHHAKLKLEEAKDRAIKQVDIPLFKRHLEHALDVTNKTTYCHALWNDDPDSAAKVEAKRRPHYHCDGLYRFKPYSNYMHKTQVNSLKRRIQALEKRTIT